MSNLKNLLLKQEELYVDSVKSTLKAYYEYAGELKTPQECAAFHKTLLTFLGHIFNERCYQIRNEKRAEARNTAHASLSQVCLHIVETDEEICEDPEKYRTFARNQLKVVCDVFKAYRGTYIN